MAKSKESIGLSKKNRKTSSTRSGVSVKRGLKKGIKRPPARTMRSLYHKGVGGGKRRFSIEGAWEKGKASTILEESKIKKKSRVLPRISREDEIGLRKPHPFGNVDGKRDGEECGTTESPLTPE